jgi:hypothetical protein
LILLEMYMARGFGGGGGVPPNMQAVMKQAQRMQQDLAKAQSEAETFEATGSAGGGVVQITANGRQEVLSVKIDPSCVSDVELLQDMVNAAANDAFTKVKEYTKTKLGSVTGGMSIPGLL